MFGTVGVPLTIVAGLAVVAIAILAVRSRQKKKARAAAAARLSAARTEQVSMAELRGSQRPKAESTVRRTPPPMETRKVDPARRFAEPRTETRRDQEFAWPSTGEWRAVAEPAANGTNGTNGNNDADSRRIAARLGGPPEQTPTRVNGAAPRPRTAPARTNGVQRTEVLPQRAPQPNGTTQRPAPNGNGRPAANGTNGASERYEQARMAQQRAAAAPQRNGQRVQRPATVPQRGPQPPQDHEAAQEPGWPAEPDWPN
jgi:hypothetical protein